jgi:hypothetical protein
MTRLQLIRCAQTVRVARGGTSFSLSPLKQATGNHLAPSNHLSKQMQIGKGCADMVRFLAAVVLLSLSGAAFLNISAAQAAPDQNSVPKPAQSSGSGAGIGLGSGSANAAAPGSGSGSGNTAGDVSTLPPAPPGKSTILGGEIRFIDPVKDVIVLRIFGRGPVKILFDERTQVFRDGKKIPLHDLRPSDHASVQTVLDGTDIFALSIHILSQTPQGDYQGRVLSYNPASTELMISSITSREPMKLLVPATTRVVREGQPGFTSGQRGLGDLVHGSLISVKFEPDRSGRGIASEIVVLATPGSQFVFSGSITDLDTHNGMLSILDPRDDKSYRISFSSSRQPVSRNLHTGDRVTISAVYDGIHYVAQSINPN